MSTQPARYLGKYELQTRLGRGGMAEVWKAFDPQLRRHVAIKLMLTELRQDPDFVVRFEREARLIASLNHPNIVKIHDFQISHPPESETPMAYMVMDYVKGQTLSDYIRNTSRKGNIPPWNDIIYLFALVGRALDYAHQKGMVHRDIKPANILLDQRLPTTRTIGEPILTDFAIARMQGMQTGTLSGTLIGTPLYIAPEQALGQHGDRRCDLYSLGIILYEITTGVTPFRGDTTISIIMQHLHELPTPPILINPRIPSTVSEIILKSLAKRPEDRYSSATDMTMALAQALDIPTPGLQQSRAASISSAGYTTPPDNRWPSVVSQENIRPEAVTPASSFHEARPLRTPSPAYTPFFGFLPEKKTQIQKLLPDTKPSQRQFKRVGRRSILLSALLLVILIGAGLGIVALHQSNNSVPPGSPIVGHVTFSHSAKAAVGEYDQIQIDMSNVPPPPQGYVYYAWLVTNTLENSPAHWQLTYNNGNLHLDKQSYPGHTDLLAPNTLFLVTKESASSAPAVPYTDPHARLYYAQTTNSSLTRFDIKACPTNSTANVCLS